MDIKLNDEYRVTSDSRQYILQRFTGSYDKNGNEVRTNVTYHGTIASLVNNLLERQVRTTELNNLIDIKESMVVYAIEITEMLEKVEHQ